MRQWFWCLGILFCCGVFAQSGLKVELVAADTTPEFFFKKFQFVRTVQDSSKLHDELKKLLQKVRSAGFASASVDTILYEGESCNVRFFVGKKISQLFLRNGNIETPFFREAGFKSVTSGQQLSISQAERLQQRLLNVAENRGYPFAEVYLDSFVDHPLSASVMMDKHELFVFDTIQLMEKVRVRQKFLSSYLGIKRGKPYEESKVKAITQRINALQFVEPIQQHSILFDKEKVITQLYLRNRKASAFNFYLGVLPGGAGQRVLITGEAKLHLFSPLGFGEQLNIEWNKTLPKTQVLRAMLAFPYIFGLPMGVDVRFELFKRDTSWLDIDREFGLRYQFAGMNFIRAALKQKTTIVLQTDTNFVIQNRTLPNALDLNTNEFSLEYFFMNLDYRFNPTKGWQLNVGGSAGERRIKRNSAINDLLDETTGETFSYLYDSIGKRSFQLQFFISLEKFWRLGKRMTTLAALKGKYFYSPLIFENEKFRIGGLATLRGFTEESIITSRYAMLNLEYRYLLSKNAFVFAFFNAAATERMNAIHLPDFPFGFGAGISVETKIGIFGLTYALGQKYDSRLSFRNSKIHFGYVNYF